MKREYDENPFIAGQPARGNDFFGREEALNRIENFISNDKETSFFIQGQRRSGKTSFLKRTQDKFKSGETLILYFNLQDKISGSIQNFFHNIQDRIIKYSDNHKLQKQEEFTDFLSTLKTESTRKIVVMLDEFDVMCESSDNESFIKYIVEIINFIKKETIPFKIIIATGRNYETETSKNCQIIENLSNKITLRPFEEQTVDKLLNISESLPFNVNAKQTLNNITAGNPFFTQALAYSVYDYAQNHNAENITPKMVKKRVKSAVKSFSYGVAVIWNHLNYTDKITLYAAAFIVEQEKKINLLSVNEFLQDLDITISKANIEDSFKRLENNSFLKYDQENMFSFVIEFFRKWITLEVSKIEIQQCFKQI